MDGNYTKSETKANKYEIRPRSVNSKSITSKTNKKPPYLFQTTPLPSSTSTTDKHNSRALYSCYYYFSNVNSVYTYQKANL